MLKITPKPSKTFYKRPSMENVSFFEWEYEGHSDRKSVEDNCNKTVAHFLENENDRDAFFKDTRPIHKAIFQNVTPDGHTYFAGNYRGAPYSQLYRRPVFIGDDSGHPPELVAQAMEDFPIIANSLLNQFHNIMKSNNESRAKKILYFSDFLSKIYVRFVAIHPYANGNGHIARLLVWTFLKRANLPLTFWTIDKRPERPLDDCIFYARRGDWRPIVEYFFIRIATGKMVSFEMLDIKPAY